jgi:hypothetical protein
MREFRLTQLRNEVWSNMHASGVEAVASSIVKFNSFGITGDPKQEKYV